MVTSEWTSTKDMMCMAFMSVVTHWKFSHLACLAAAFNMTVAMSLSHQVPYEREVHPQ